MEGSFFTNFMPHGYCYAWNPGILWTSVLSDLSIALAYFSIPIALLILIRKRKDIKFKGIFILFALFILLCGVTHLASIYTIWFGAYGMHALSKLATAVVSIATAVVLFLNIGKALAIPSMDQHKKAVNEAAEERIKRNLLEQERRSEAIFKFTTQLVPTGLLVIDQSQKIRLANQAAEQLFGYSADEIVGMDLSSLIEELDQLRHSILVKHFLESTHSSHSMAAGRTVTGKTKSGGKVTVEIKIAVHDFEDERFAFANIINSNQSLEERNKLSEHRDRIVRAIEATNEGVWEWNVQTSEVWYSPKLMKLIGQPENQKGSFDHWEAHIHPDDRPRVFDMIQEHFKTKNAFDAIYRGMTGGGEYEWMHTRGNTIFDTDGAALLMTGTLSNINEVQTLRETLDEKTRFLNEVLDKSLTGIYIFNLAEKRHMYINPEFTNLCGWTLDELNELHESQGLLSLFHPNDKDRMYQHFNNVKQQLNIENLGEQYRFKHKNGHWLWCYSRDSILTFDEAGSPVQMLGAFFDITEIKLREEEVRQLAMNFTGTFEQAAVGMALVNMDGKFQKVNSKLCHTLGYDEGELVGVDFRDITYAEDIGNSEQAVSSLMDVSESQVALKKRYVKKDGSIIWAQLTLALVVDENGENSHFVSVIDDISERVAIENELAASNASLERFAYSASHDLQEPLRKISAFAGLLVERLNGKLQDKDAIFQLDRISDSAKRMGEMIQSLLDLSRFSREKIEKNAIPLSELIEQVKEDLAPKILSTGTTIELKQDVLIFVEKNSFQQVLRNLILNSIQYAKIGTPCHIVLKVRKLEKTTEIYLEDNGISFADEYSAVIFEPFRRLVPREIKGTGMGLAICRQIMHSHDGEILAQPIKDGAQFILILPRGSSQDAQ